MREQLRGVLGKQGVREVVSSEGGRGGGWWGSEGGGDRQ